MYEKPYTIHHIGLIFFQPKDVPILKQHIDWHCFFWLNTPKGTVKATAVNFFFRLNTLRLKQVTKTGFCMFKPLMSRIERGYQIYKFYDFSCDFVKIAKSVNFSNFSQPRFANFTHFFAFIILILTQRQSGSATISVKLAVL